jgi:hypothetical protein
MKNNKQKLFVLLVILAVSIFGSVMLTKQTQDVRRKAAETYVQSFEPTAITGLKVGETALVTLYADTPLGFKSATVLICYPDYLKELTTNDIKLSSYFTIELPPVRRVELGYTGKICSVVEAMVSTMDASATGAPAGLVEIAKLNFTGFKAGKSGKIEAIIGPVSGTEYGKTTNKNFKSLVSGDYTDGQDKVFSAVDSVAIDVVDDVTGNEYILKFRMVFPGVWPNNKYIEGYEKVKLMVESGIGTTWLGDVTMTKVAASETTSIKEGNEPYQVYEAKVPLTNFPYNENLAVTIKGIKHLGMRFGGDDQMGCYRAMLGTLDGLTKDESTPVFNFVKTPLQGGDVDGNDLVNAVDYTNVKNALDSIVCKEENKCPKEDINGDGVINAADTTYINLTVSNKCGDWWTTGE